MQTPRFGNGPAWDSDPHFHVVTHPNRILVWISDRLGFVSYVSPQWPALTGIHTVSLLGHGWHAAIHPLDLPELLQTIRDAAAAAAAFRQKLRLRRHDGSHLAMVMEGQPQLDEHQAHIGFVVTCIDVSHPSEADLELDIAEERLTDLIRESQLPGLVVDSGGKIVFLNDAFCRLTRKSPSELQQQALAAALGIAGETGVVARLYPQGVQATDFPSSFETPVVRADGVNRIVSWHAIVMRNQRGQAKGAVLLGEDVTQQVETERKLLLTQRAFETTAQAMVITDERGTILSVNEAFTRLTGYPAGEAIGQNPRILQSGRHDRDFYQAMWQSIQQSGHWHGDIWDRRKDGSLYPKFLSISAIRDESGRITNYSGIFYDITERKSIEEQLDRLAHFDALTGLANRVLFFDHAESALSLARRSDHQVGLLFVDLDNFKDINDTLGHDAGDDLLKTVAERLRGCIRRHDTAARLGGDEFILLLPELDGAEMAAHVGRKVLSEISAPIEIAGRNCIVTPSIGISIFPQDASTIDELMRHADQAMYRAKAGGRAALAFYTVTPEGGT